VLGDREHLVDIIAIRLTNPKHGRRSAPTYHGRNRQRTDGVARRHAVVRPADESTRASLFDQDALQQILGTAYDADAMTPDPAAREERGASPARRVHG
jgi:hypothetical protein